MFGRRVHRGVVHAIACPTCGRTLRCRLAGGYYYVMKHNRPKGGATCPYSNSHRPHEVAARVAEDDGGKRR